MAQDAAREKADYNDDQIHGQQVLNRKVRKKLCKWYYACPIVDFTNQGKLEKYWVENYCEVSNRNCIRYQMEETGEYHPDNMLPDGTIREDLV